MNFEKKAREIHKQYEDQFRGFLSDDFINLVDLIEMGLREANLAGYEECREYVLSCIDKFKKQ